MAAQLEHSLHIADTRIGMAKSPNQADHWRSMHRQVSELIDEAGFVWRAGRLVDPSRRPAPELKSMAKSFGSASRAVAYNELRSEVMQSLAKARADGDSDSDSRIEFCQMRRSLELSAAAAGYGLNGDMKFVSSRG